MLPGLLPAELPPGYWPPEQSRPILDTTQRVELAPGLSHLTGVEFQALEELLAADLERLERYPAIQVLHAGLGWRLKSEPVDTTGFYAVPYALAYAPELAEVRNQLLVAARLLQDPAPDFAAYLRNRGRDFLSGDYESGDASWVSGDVGNLNLQIGSYETYDDALLGTKAFFSASVLARDRAGEYEQAVEFVRRWNYWDDSLHGTLAESIRRSGKPRYTMVRYHALRS